ncbi:RNA helicase [Metarhizium rileyi]|uniref:RNA helicase n=1 Tax=Metarhizium rileyi (strain RCEF 4871) TaxID=1649241 RepID=A0A5C6GFS1_METRR|nr:RNA helicase [Metarhizium rileyi]
MPRPRRARQTQQTTDPKPAEPVAVPDSHDEQRGRAKGRTRSTRSMRTRLSLEEEAAVRAANRARDAALDSLANEDPTSTAGPDDTRSSIEIGRRAMATPAMRRDTTGLDLADDDVFGDLDDSFADGHVPEAPHSAASSSATLSHFKTRPRSRQSSIIGRSDPPIRPSSRGGNTPGVSSSFNIGVFRRRAREPSILATSRRARSQTGSVTSSRAGSVARDSELESEGEFAPEAESTPLHSRRRSRRSQEHGARDASPSPSCGGSRRSIRKRKSEDTPPPESSRPEKMARVEANGGIHISSDSELSELASPSPPAACFARAVTPVNMDEINAPPASSDSEADDSVWPDIHTLAKKRRRPSIHTPLRNDKDDLSDVSSPPSLTHSPNLATRTRASKPMRSPHLTTADLTSLLPKRRYKRDRQEFDIDTDDDGEESGQDARPRRSKGSRPPSRATSRRGQNVLRPKQISASVRRSARTASKTHGREEDKENETEDEQQDDSQFQPLPDDTFDGGASVAQDVQNADELKRASRKFKEVDQWELSFEEAVEPPSPQGAR